MALAIVFARMIIITGVDMDSAFRCAVPNILFTCLCFSMLRPEGNVWTIGHVSRETCNLSPHAALLTVGQA